MTASQYHSSDVPFMGAFFVCELFEDMREERASKYFSNYVMADDFIYAVEAKYPEAEFFIAHVDSEKTLQYILNIEGE